LCINFGLVVIYVENVVLFHLIVCLGHFSEVDDCWRLLFAAVSLVKSVRLSVASQHLVSFLCYGEPSFALYILSKPFKCVSFLNILNSCVSQQAIPLQNSTSIPVFNELSKWDFVDQFLTRSKPAIIKGLISHWPAIEKWSFGYLHRILARRVVPVEQGSKYTDSSWSQTLMTGSEFFRKCTLLERGPLYLAQHRLFDQIPQLCDDFCLPLYCDHCDEVDRNCWIGPGGTISPLHTDPRENLFCQISGRKFFRLVPSVDTENVYAFKDGITTNTSQVDALNPNLDEYPDFARAQCWDGVVEGGDVLFIPKGWWHFVSSLSNSISISFWFDA
uniref:JmjC domain-containing protein n=1 Tax=Angiostrongylus costaricensis TaxID=334426 RepID=A0A0R3PEZ9_ANGCS